MVRWWREPEGWVIAALPKQAEIDLALGWGSAKPGPGVWTAPGGSSGYELRMSEAGGRLIDHSVPRVHLRWFDGLGTRGQRGEVAWFFPAASVEGIEPPTSARAVTLWSQPRFQVD
jgi:hypothetical protein